MMFLNPTRSDSDWLHNTQSKALQSDWLIRDNDGGLLFFSCVLRETFAMAVLETSSALSTD